MSLSRRISAGVALVTVVVFAGWALDQPELLAAFIPGRTVTRPESASGFLLAALGVWGLTSDRKGWRWLGGACATLTALLGCTLLIAHGLGFLGPIHPALPESPTGIRITSVPTASGQLFASLAILLSSGRSERALRLFDAATVLILSWGTLVTLASLYGWYDAAVLAVAFRHAALPSGLCMIGLGLSAALMRPERGVAKAVLEPGPSAALLRRLLPAAVLLPAALYFLETLAEHHGWFEGLGNAPFAVAEAVGIAALVVVSARSVQRYNSQREAAQRALAKEMQAHADLLAERELWYRVLAEASPQIIWTAQADGGLNYMSPAWERFTGVPAQGYQGFRWEERLHPQDAGRVTRVWKQAVERGEPYQAEYRLRRQDGVYRWFLSQARPFFGADGKIVRWYGADLEIHDLHETREALRLSETRFRLALSSRDFIAWTQDAHLKYTWVFNPASGYEAEVSLGRTDFELLDVREDAERLVKLKRGVLESGQTFSGEVPLLVKGEQRYFEMRLAPLWDSEGELSGLAGSAYDVTARKQSEAVLLDAQKYESIARLAGGVAHDFNNLLTGIIGNTDFVLSKLPAEVAPSLRSALERVVRSGESAAQLTQQLLAYAGKGRFHVEPTDLVRLKDSMAGLIRATLSGGVRIEYDIPSSLPHVNADRYQLQQLLMNLLLNAIEAVSERGGVVRLRMRHVKLDADALLELDLCKCEPGSFVELEVLDDGPGMSKETLERAFEPFFSTKFSGRGLGLAAAQGIAQAHGGVIVARSELSQGTSMRVVLPALEKVHEQAADAGPKLTSALPTRVDPSAGVLFVDDELELREVAKQALSDAGYRVFTAENGAEAVETMKREGRDIQAVVLDLTMPVMSGAEAARILRREHANVPLVASSGYSEAETLERFGETSPLFLRKPYRSADLLAAVAIALERVHQRQP